MFTRFAALCALSVFLMLGFVLVVSAQDQATPTGTATSEEVYCATPLVETTASPEIVASAPTTAASPGGSEPGTPIGLFPCGTPSP
jgi:hypothetical protein